MSEPSLGAAIIGTAHSHALGHMEAIRASKNWELIGVAEPNPALLGTARANTRWKGVSWASIDAVLSDSRVRMICIETDPLESLSYSLRTIEAGKHLKIDKPPGVDYALLLQDLRRSPTPSSACADGLRLSLQPRLPACLPSDSGRLAGADSLDYLSDERHAQPGRPT